MFLSLVVLRVSCSARLFGCFVCVCNCVVKLMKIFSWFACVSSICVCFFLKLQRSWPLHDCVCHVRIKFMRGSWKCLFPYKLYSVSINRSSQQPVCVITGTFIPHQASQLQLSFLLVQQWLPDTDDQYIMFVMSARLCFNNGTEMTTLQTASVLCWVYLARAWIQLFSQWLIR